MKCYADLVRSARRGEDKVLDVLYAAAKEFEHESGFIDAFVIATYHYLEGYTSDEMRRAQNYLGYWYVPEIRLCIPGEIGGLNNRIYEALLDSGI